MYISKLRCFSALLLVLALPGCAGSISQWIVDTRVHQGDIALARGQVRDAELAYQLALRVDPKNQRARTGFVAAAAGLAQAEYAKGAFEDALTTIRGGLALDPDSVRLDGLRRTIEQAKLKREIVISNYPTYHETGVALQQAYAGLDSSNKAILKSLRRFGYTFDADDLTEAIKRSYELQLDIAKNTNRLITYRQVVTSGVPEVAPDASAGATTSLLPLP
jgi:tetratricopeptide (TPR) repeat protein